ncbi:tetratricopeptide (TPR) repeat protein [Rhizomicrobium palustre]|uniref:Tetratricopeptide (TPR) repeat protein n=1 Tax=Rhizomicrobium palustre TaxID=189966 RepID=A0A846N044_9PROT|nr:hypothetical protein [Rhizomicrobium palustre]NIK88557.1 tetratricopeptide (TPR) repeat protein [Rhizomicrobium palustre]
MIAKNLRAAATALVVGMAALAASMPADAAVRSAVGKPLQEAQTLAASGNYAGAMSKVKAAEAVGGLSAEEAKIVKQMKDYITVKSGGAAGPVDSAVGAQAKFNADYRAGKYREVIADEELLRKYSALTAEYQVVIAQAYYQLGDYKGCVNYATSHTGAGTDMIKRGMLCAFKTGDDQLSRDLAEKLVAANPSPENWSQLIGSAERAKGLTDSQTRDIYRIKLLTGNMKGADDYFTLAQLLIAAKAPFEAGAVVEKGQAAKLLVDARAQRLAGLVKQAQATNAAGFAKAMADAQKAKDGEELLRIGEDLTGQGKYADAVSAIQAGIGKGVKDTDNAQIRLAVAQFGNKQKAAALSSLEKAKSNPNSKLVSHMWAIYIRNAK